MGLVELGLVAGLGYLGYKALKPSDTASIKPKVHILEEVPEDSIARYSWTPTPQEARVDELLEEIESLEEIDDSTAVASVRKLHYLAIIRELDELYLAGDSDLKWDMEHRGYDPPEDVLRTQLRDEIDEALNEIADEKEGSPGYSHEMRYLTNVYACENDAARYYLLDCGFIPTVEGLQKELYRAKANDNSEMAKQIKRLIKEAKGGM